MNEFKTVEDVLTIDFPEGIENILISVELLSSLERVKFMKMFKGMVKMYITEPFDYLSKEMVKSVTSYEMDKIVVWLIFGGVNKGISVTTGYGIENKSLNFWTEPNGRLIPII